MRETLVAIPPSKALAVQMKKKERKLREELERVQRAEGINLFKNIIGKIKWEKQ